MSEFVVGQKVKFDWGYQSQILNGVILQVKERPLMKPKYRVAYGIGDFGIKHTDSNCWVREKNIFKINALNPSEEDKG